jgi:flagellar basal-body rod protein FlgG
MNVSLYQAASALQAMDRWQEAIAENLASATVPGFKKQEVSFEAVPSGRHHATSAPGSTSSAVMMVQSGPGATNFQAGEFRTTQVKTDLAIDGPGFFEVELPGGHRAFTRDGEFHLNATGQLVTKEGYTVLGDGGPIQLDLNNYTELSVSPTGEVSQGTDLKGRLRVTEFSRPQSLHRLSGGYFTAGNNPDAGATPSTTSTLRQGVLESANTSVVREMANLMVAMRTFEANQRMAQLHDDRMARAINDLSATT